MRRLYLSATLIFWLLVVLAVIYWVLSRVALPRIGGVISDRQGAITGLIGGFQTSSEYRHRVI